MVEIRKDIEYPAVIVTGCSRSGTAFMADLLTQGGVPCTHEAYFGFPFFGCTYREGAIAESSWLSAPFLKREKDRGALIIHIVRHPLKQISSMAHARSMEDHNFRSNLYTMTKELFLPTLRRLRLEDRYLYNWLKWNAMGEQYADFTYRLEDIVKNPKGLFDDLGIPVDGIKFDTKKKNSYSNVKQYDWSDFRDCLYYDELIHNAHRYKYLTDEESDELLKLGEDRLNVEKNIANSSE